MVVLVAEVLPSIVPNLVLSSRVDIIPMIMTCINKHREKKMRENLFSLLFNMMKRPDDRMRSSILSGIFWLLHQRDWSKERTEEEVLPHILEQINLKYSEKKILVGECLVVISNHVDASIRSSLLVALSSQLLEDSDTAVVVAGIKTLAYLMNMMEEDEKIEQMMN